MQMSHDTGGEVFRNTNDLGAALVHMANQTSVTYVLSFQPQGLKQDGAYHPIKVQLRNAPRGTKVSARSGYYAPRPFNQQRPAEKMLSLADQLMGANQGGSIATAVLAEPFRTAGAKGVRAGVRRGGRRQPACRFAGQGAGGGNLRLRRGRQRHRRGFSQSAPDGGRAEGGAGLPGAALSVWALRSSDTPPAAVCRCRCPSARGSTGAGGSSPSAARRRGCR